MFTTSTHKQNWIFKDEAELRVLRENCNRGFVEEAAYKVQSISEEEKSRFFLSKEDERELIKYYELQLTDFCKHFNPTMPQEVYGTAFHYMKRFYLYNSVMDFHPKEILVTCVYLACKVEEFNISIKQFVSNVRGDREKATDVILNNELLLMQRLNYQLVVYNIYKPIEGLLLDLKTRSRLRDPERLRPGIEKIIDKLYLTDACLLYTPSQLGLATILHSASKIHENLDDYVTRKLLGRDGSPNLLTLIEAVRKIRTFLTIVMENGDMVSNKESIKEIEKRLEKCRSEENNPNSELFREKLRDVFFDEEERVQKK